jgi:hypothetical protein
MSVAAQAFPSMLADALRRKGWGPRRLAKALFDCQDARREAARTIRRLLRGTPDPWVNVEDVLEAAEALGLGRLERDDFIYSYRMMCLGLPTVADP